MMKPFSCLWFGKKTVVSVLIMTLAVPFISQGQVSRNFSLDQLSIKPATGQAQASGNRSLDQLAKKADVIVVGKVDNKKAEWVGNLIQTDYRIRAREYWKGDLGPEFEFTQLGGEVYHPLPIAMDADGSAYLYEGEEVVLFLRNPKNNLPVKKSKLPNARSKLWNSFQVAGWGQGKFTIINDPKTGEDKVAQLGKAGIQLISKKEMDKRCEAAAEFAKKKAGKEAKQVKKPSPAGNSALRKELKGDSKSAPGAGDSNQQAIPPEVLKKLKIEKWETLEGLKSSVKEILE